MLKNARVEYGGKAMNMKNIEMLLNGEEVPSMHDVSHLLLIRGI